MTVYREQQELLDGYKKILADGGTLLLEDIDHYDEWVKFTKPYNINSNRFLVFDRKGIGINMFYLKKIPNFLKIKVLDIALSSYSGYSVGFTTTHIKLDLDVFTPNQISIRFGEPEID